MKVREPDGRDVSYESVSRNLNGGGEVGTQVMKVGIGKEGILLRTFFKGFLQSRTQDHDLK